VKRAIFLVPIFVCLVLLGGLYVFLGQGPPSALPSPLVGQSAPDFNLPALDAEAESFSRGDLGTGKPIVVNFFASWCAPCRIEHPTLQALAAQKDVIVYGIDYKEALYGKTAKDARDFLTELGNPYSKINKDDDGRVSIDWGVTGVPETFVVDAKGIIRVHYSGPLSPDIVQKLILPALRQSGG
jgi:cytochrome c biogenesis protein CcmG/thiol:disulfide interchange protein DsbE